MIEGRGEEEDEGGEDDDREVEVVVEEIPLSVGVGEGPSRTGRMTQAWWLQGAPTWMLVAGVFGGQLGGVSSGELAVTFTVSIFKAGRRDYRIDVALVIQGTGNCSKITCPSLRDIESLRIHDFKSSSLHAFL